MSTITERREVYGTERWKRLRKRVLDAFNWRCSDCGRPGRLEVHHRKPIKDGGAVWDPANLKPLCGDCHRAQHVQISPNESDWDRHIERLCEVTG